MVDRIMVMYGGYIVEEAVLDDIYKSPLHPYTIGLLKSIPSLKTEAGSRLPSIPGAPPNLFAQPTGCPFAPRCAYRVDRCTSEVPTLSALPGTEGDRPHRVACWVDMRGRGMAQ
jgi:oligopeptide/dipeptide ABC transporter ATP-binding protein